MYGENWNDLKEKIKLNYPVISEEDLVLNDGEELLEILARLQIKFSKTNEEIITMVGKL
ncbi:MAG: hypothetical protein WCA84_12695 [Ignavibacteriaceae bacterium]|jgi:hypothetical protein